jgi:hypothetical protein
MKTFAITIWFLLSLVVSQLNAQSIRLSIDRNRILIGEQINATLTIYKNKSWQIADLTPLPDSFNHLEILDRKVESLDGDNSKMAYSFVITSFDTGKWEFPSIAVEFEDSANNIVSQRSSSQMIEVVSADVSNLKGYHDIKDIVSLPKTKDSSISFALIASVFIVVLVIVVLLIKSRKKKTSLEKRTDSIGLVLERLEMLKKKELKQKDYYQQLYEISRSFFVDTFSNEVQHYTTEEWIIQFNGFSIDEKLKTNFYDLLKKSDAIRFGANSAIMVPKDDEIQIVRKVILQLDKIKSI